MSIAPIVRSVQVKADPARAFELFVGRMQDWWPKGRTIAKNPHVAIVAEPRAGGRWYEIDAEGNETEWGKVLSWNPPTRVVFAWQIGADWKYDPGLVTEVEMTFAPAQGGGTIVTLEHRDLERFGPTAAAPAAALNGGWPTHLAQFAEFADANS